jgi:multidrug transporter EmrE-like cation transporter
VQVMAVAALMARCYAVDINLLSLLMKTIPFGLAYAI